MKFVILEAITRTSKAGKPYNQAACKGISKNGMPYLFLANIPDDLKDEVGSEVDRMVVFGNGGSAFVMPY